MGFVVGFPLLLLGTENFKVEATDVCPILRATQSLSLGVRFIFYVVLWQSVVLAAVNTEKACPLKPSQNGNKKHATY